MKSFAKDCALDIKREWFVILIWTVIVAVLSFCLGALVRGATTENTVYMSSVIIEALKLDAYAIGIIGVFLVILIVVVVIQESLKRIFERII